MKEYVFFKLVDWFMKRFIVWCSSVGIFALSIWGFGTLFVTKVLSDAKQEVLISSGKIASTTKVLFSTNTLFIFSFLLIATIGLITFLYFVPLSKLRNYDKVIKEKFISVAKDDKSLVAVLSKLMILALIFFSILLVMNLSFSYMGLQDQMGVFGDFLGGVLNPILSFLSLIAILLTIVLQSKELRETRKEIKNSAEAQSKAEKALNQQAFENTFFNMINLHNNIVQNLEFTNLIGFENYYSSVNKKSIRGRNVFSHLTRLLGKKVRSFPGETGLDFEKVSASETKKRYHILQTKNNEVLGHYFRNLYQTINFVDSYSSFSFKEKKKYLKILRSQLSSNELALLFLNCLDSSVDKGQFKSLVIKYELLKHIPFGGANKDDTKEFIELVNSGKNIKPFISGCFYVSMEQISQYALFKNGNCMHSSAFGNENIGFELYKSAGFIAQVASE